MCFIAILGCGCAHIRYPIYRYEVITYLSRINKGEYLPLQFPMYFYSLDSTYSSYIFGDACLYIHVGDRNLFWTVAERWVPYKLR